MKKRTILSVVCLAGGATLAIVLLLASSGTTGMYHSGSSLICFDCHTMHYSQAHDYVSANPPAGGAVLSGGPNAYLLRQANICLACHDGQASAPDVYGANFNASPTGGRSAGAISTGTTPFEAWKGHYMPNPGTNTTAPPGYDAAGTLTGAAANWYTGTTNGLQCGSCHDVHGNAAYRNLGPPALGANAANFQPSYVISTTNTTTSDVWININPATYTAGSGSAATFNPYYDTNNIFYNRNDAAMAGGTDKTSNKVASLCAACHAQFHGGPGNTNIGGQTWQMTGFLRHPTAQITLGASGGQGYAAHSTLAQYTAANNKVKVASSTQGPAYTDASPFCGSCHKAHGNQNPFGLIFMARTPAGTIYEEGTQSGPSNANAGTRNLCGQCHSQGN